MEYEGEDDGPELPPEARNLIYATAWYPFKDLLHFVLNDRNGKIRLLGNLQG